MPSSHKQKFPLVRPSAAPTVTEEKLLVNGDDHIFRRMVHDSLAFAARIEAIRDGYARLIGISGVQYTILIAVNHLQFDENVSVTRVAEHLHLSGAFITNETNKLVRLGLLLKGQDPEDGRRLILRTTEEAQQRLARLAEVQSEVNDEHFGPLAKGDNFEIYRRLVSELVDSTDRALALLHGLTPRAIASGRMGGLQTVGDASAPAKRKTRDR